MEENQMVKERMELSKERLLLLQKEESVNEPYRSYFQKQAAFLCELLEISDKVLDGSLYQMDLSALSNLNHALYKDILPGTYEESYCNPETAFKIFGEDYGQLLCFLASEIRSVIPAVFEGRLNPVAAVMELFIEIYNYFEEISEFTSKNVKKAIYYYVHDYCEDFIHDRVREMLDPTFTFAYDITMNSDLSDLRYLYFYGEYVSENEIRIASFLNSMSQDQVQSMADTYTEGYVRGFQMVGADFSKKGIIDLRTCLGFERMTRYAVKNFEKIGKKVTIPRVASDVINRRYGRKVGYHGTSPNLQYEYDHRFDRGLFFDKNLKELMISSLRQAYDTYKLEAVSYAGPAVIETFGEEDFEPVNKAAAIRLDEKQTALLTEYTGESMMIMMEYMPSEETSFTIIAYPLPSIGEKFEEIFAETVKVNTLDNEAYKKIQQHLIDALDLGTCAVITGKGENRTSLTVALRPLTDSSKETKFENCTADVNIPVGEVFTSPQLHGTNGLLHVSRVFLNGLEYRDLEIRFKDGFVSDYTCGNFSSEEENKAFVHENILMNRETLPLGEFAIGTNTTAYVMGIKYNIQKKLPILIAEKTGPHFAVGDTCYSHSEDHKVYNPDGKEIVARENELSALRTTDPKKAYVNCHTDITIPYNEIGEIAVVNADGTKTPLILDGRFVLPGTEILNDAFEELK